MITRLPNVTPEGFRHIKLLLAGGATPEEIQKLLGYSRSTVMRIKRSETYDDYKGLQADYKANEKAAEAKKEAEKEPEKPKEEPKPVVHNVTIQATHYMMEELRKQNELLTLISNKLAFIVEALQ